MTKFLELTVSGSKPLRHGVDYVWSLILDLTKETDVFTYSDIKGMCDQERLPQVRRFLEKLTAAGFLDRLPASRPKGARGYRLLKRQSNTPILRTDLTGESTLGLGIQQMWNVMRRARSGFTVADLAIDASTEDVPVSHQHAHLYCLLLERAGILKKLRTGERGAGCSIYVLLGSANTGPKAPRRYRSVFVYDQNKGRVVGSMTAEEVAP